MNKLFKILLLSVLPFFQLAAQVPFDMGDDLLLRIIESKERNGKGTDHPGIEGTTFLHDEFKDGSVLSVDARYDNVKVRYNILEDVFHFRMGRQVMVLDPKSQIKMVIADKDIFVVKTYNYKMRTVIGFLQQHAEGNYSLFSKKNISLRPAKPPQALSTEGTPAQYIRKSDTYFLEMPDGSMEIVKSGKDIAALFENTKLKAEAKDQKISLKKKEHMPILVQLINEMKL